MVWILPMTTPNFVEEPPVIAPKVRHRSSSPARAWSEISYGRWSHRRRRSEKKESKRAVR